MSEILVFGHKSPDTDSVFSAIVYAWYLKEVMGAEAKACRIGELNRETKFLLDKFEVTAPDFVKDIPDGTDVVVVDTNNAEELVPNINKLNIKQIIDHHKLAGNLATDKPIFINTRSLGCTMSVIHEMVVAAGIFEKMPEKLKLLMLSTIISDTLLFRSPSTTQKDKEILEALEKATGINASTLADEMFAAKSDLSGMSARDIVLYDSKIYEVAGKNSRISVLETTNTTNALSMKDALKIEMNDVAKEESLGEVFMFVIDILKEEAIAVVSNDTSKALVEKAFNVKIEGDTIILPGVVSRKVQIVPALSNV